MPKSPAGMLRKRIAKLRAWFHEPRIARRLDAWLDTRPDAFVMQVGANDGVSGDPISAYIRARKLPALLIEPQPDVFGQLQENYADFPNAILENCAISDRNEQRELIRLVPDEIKAFRHSGMASLVRTRHLQEQDKTNTITVDCFTPSHLLEKHHIAAVDILVSDVEGFDFEVLKAFDFERFHPHFIRYEHKHLNQTDRLAARQYLRSYGYQLTELKMDTVAFSH